MAAATVLVSGAGIASAIDIVSPSGAKPGTLWASVGSTTTVPQLVDVTMTARSVTMQWRDCKLAKHPRVFRRGSELLFHDSRWKLRESVIGRAFNQPLFDGRISDETSLADVWAEIASASGLSIRTENLPDLKPPVEAGVTCEEAAGRLLEMTACRMVYDPVAIEYVVSPAGTGALPDLSERLRRPVQVEVPQEVIVSSAPAVYEADIACDAVVVAADGTLENMLGNAEFSLGDFFTAFESEADARRELLQSSAFRLWKPTGVSYPEALTPDRIRILGHRIQSLGAGTYAMPQASAVGMMNYPSFHYVPTNTSKSLARIGYAERSDLFVADRPVLAVNGSIPRTTVGILCAYQKLDSNGVPYRETETRNISGGTGAAQTVFADWVRPVETESTRDGVDETQWQTVLAAIADAMQVKHQAAREHVRVRSLVPTGGSGQIGGFRYRAQLGGLATLETSMHFNYVPSGASTW